MEPGTRTNGPASLELVRMMGIDDSVTEGLLEIKSMLTAKPARNQGHASRLMAAVCKEADKDGTFLVLTPKQFDNGPIGTEQLKAWYERFGFTVIQDKPVLMCRDAKVGFAKAVTDAMQTIDQMEHRYLMHKVNSRGAQARPSDKNVSGG